VVGQTLAGKKILSAPVVGAPDDEDNAEFIANASGQDIICFVDIRDVCCPRKPEFLKLWPLQS
jgi:hypothetical protein